MYNKKKKFFKLTEIIIGSFLLVSFILFTLLELIAPKSAISIYVQEHLWSITEFFDWFKRSLPAIIGYTLLIIIVHGISKIIRYLIHRRTNNSPRAKTFGSLLEGFIKYAAWIIIFFIILSAIGINTSALLASVGILTLIVGLGAQPLIADVIAGMFIFFDNEYNVGEIVSIDNFRGTVIEIGLRSTKILDAGGNIKIINNNDIKNIVNMSREISVAVCDCEYPYEEPIERLEQLLKANLPLWKNKIPEILKTPEYKGVASFGNSNVIVKIIAECKEEDRFQVQRDMLKEYRQMLLDNGIDISYTQVVISSTIDKTK